MPWYKDPLFGIVLLFLIIAIIGAIDFIRNRLKERRRTHSLENLKKSYEFLGIKDGVEEFLRLNQNATPTLEQTGALDMPQDPSEIAAMDREYLIWKVIVAAACILAVLLYALPYLAA